MPDLSQRYYEVKISKTGKSRGNTRAPYQLFDEERLVFPSIPQIKEWLTETYGMCKRMKMFQDLPNGQPKQVGWIYCFKNEDWSHHPAAKWWQQDWVKIHQIKATAILI